MSRLSKFTCNRSFPPQEEEEADGRRSISTKFRHPFRFEGATKPFTILVLPPFHLPGCAPFVASSYMFARTRRNVSPDGDGFRSPRAIETGTERRYEDAKGVIDGFGWFMGAAGAIVVACYDVSHLY